MSPEERQALKRLRRVIAHFRITFGPDVSATAIQAVVEVALQDGLSLSEYQRRLYSDASQVARLLNEMSRPATKRGTVREHFVRRDEENPDGPLFALSSRGKLLRKIIVDELTGA